MFPSCSVTTCSLPTIVKWACYSNTSIFRIGSYNLWLKAEDVTNNTFHNHRYCVNSSTLGRCRVRERVMSPYCGSSSIYNMKRCVLTVCGSHKEAFTSPLFPLYFKVSLPNPPNYFKVCVSIHSLYVCILHLQKFVKKQSKCSIYFLFCTHMGG